MSNVAAGAVIHTAFSYQSYTIRKKVFKLFGGAFHIYNPADEVVFYSDMKAFKLKEDIRVYTGEDKQHELLSIQARKILDISAAYDVVDPTTNEKVGVLKRKGMKSLIKDEWIIMNANDQEVGLISEDSMVMALIRRFVIGIIPQTFHGEINNVPVCTFKQNFNPFVSKIALDFSPDVNKMLDRRLGIAAAILLCAIEGRQQSY
jgi:uncharacterized protein YxjI